MVMLSAIHTEGAILRDVDFDAGKVDSATEVADDVITDININNGADDCTNNDGLMVRQLK